MGNETRELLQKRLNEACDQLGKIEATDKEKRTAKTAEITALTNALTNLDKVENERINNNLKNSTEEARVKVDAERVEVDKKRIRTSWWQIGIGIVAGLFGSTWGYILNENMQPDSRLQKFADKCSDTVSKIKF